MGSLYTLKALDRDGRAHYPRIHQHISRMERRDELSILGEALKIPIIHALFGWTLDQTKFASRLCHYYLTLSNIRRKIREVENNGVKADLFCLWLLLSD